MLLYLLVTIFDEAASNRCRRIHARTADKLFVFASNPDKFNVVKVAKRDG